MEKRQGSYWPTHSWQAQSPQKARIDAFYLEKLHAYLGKLTCIHNILLVRSGFIIFEEYYQGWNAHKYHNIMFCTKTIVSSLIGIALHRGYLHSIDRPLLDFFLEYTSQIIDPRKQAITLRHLLTMTSGYDRPNAWGSSNDIATFLDESDAVIKILERPMKNNPGQVYSYDNMNMHLLGLILTRTTGMSLAQFAYTTLFQPLGIWQDEAGTPFPWKAAPDLIDEPHPFGLWDKKNEYLWSIDKQGYFIGSFGLQLTPREMAKYGYLYLNQGQWDNQQIIPATYIRDTIQYGYVKQSAQWHEHRVSFNTGAFGQVIAVIPDLDLIAVMAAFCNEHNHLKDILVDLVIPALV